MKISELLIRMIAPLFFVLIGTCIIFPFSDGLPVLGIPKADDIIKVEITDNKNNETVVFTDSEYIQLAVNMKNFTFYKVNSSKVSDKTGDISIKYFTSETDFTELSADAENVYWKGKARKLKKPEQFVKLADAVFLK